MIKFNIKNIIIIIRPKQDGFFLFSYIKSGAVVVGVLSVCLLSPNFYVGGLIISIDVGISTQFYFSEEFDEKNKNVSKSQEPPAPQKKFIVICGHYKGIDERVIEKFVTHEYSLGDFVMTGGEIPAMVMLDSAVRLIPGTLNTLDSALTDSFSQDLLDHPHYTQPREIDGLEVPKVLLGGHHANIEAWRQEKKEERTKEKRPDLWEKFEKLNESEKNHA